MSAGMISAARLMWTEVEEAVNLGQADPIPAVAQLIFDFAHVCGREDCLYAGTKSPSKGINLGQVNPDVCCASAAFQSHPRLPV